MQSTTLHTILIDALTAQLRYMARLANYATILPDDKDLTSDETSSRLRLHGLIVSSVRDILEEHTTLARVIETFYDMHAEVCDSLRIDSNLLTDRAISELEIKRCILRKVCNDLLSIAGLAPLHY